VTDHPGPDDELHSLEGALFAEPPAEASEAAARRLDSTDDLERDLFADAPGDEAGDQAGDEANSGAAGGAAEGFDDEVDLFAAIPDVAAPPPAPLLEEELPGLVAAAEVATPPTEPEPGPEADPFQEIAATREPVAPPSEAADASGPARAWWPRRRSVHAENAAPGRPAVDGWPGASARLRSWYWPAGAPRSPDSPAAVTPDPHPASR
jgi:hypothetical protein